MLHQTRGADIGKLWNDIRSAIAKAFFSCQACITYWITKYVKKRSNAFEILGFDFLCDDNLNPWLLEVNHSPQFTINARFEMENFVKRSLFENLFNLIDITCELSALLYEENAEKWKILEEYFSIKN